MKWAMPAARAPGTIVSPNASMVSTWSGLSRRNGTFCAWGWHADTPALSADARRKRLRDAVAASRCGHGYPQLLPLCSVFGHQGWQLPRARKECGLALLSPCGPSLFLVVEFALDAFFTA